MLTREQLDYKIEILKEDYEKYKTFDRNEKLAFLMFATETIQDFIDNNRLYSAEEYKCTGVALQKLSELVKQ